MPQHRLDVVGLLLVAVALSGNGLRASRMQSGLNAEVLGALAIGLVAAVAFVIFERRTRALHRISRIFASGPFDAAVFAGIAFNFLSGGVTVLLAFYLVAVRGESTHRAAAF